LQQQSQNAKQYVSVVAQKCKKLLQKNKRFCCKKSGKNSKTHKTSERLEHRHICCFLAEFGTSIYFYSFFFLFFCGIWVTKNAMWNSKIK